MPADLGALETAIGHVFLDRELFQRALTHKSSIHERSEHQVPSTRDNEDARSGQDPSTHDDDGQSGQGLIQIEIERAAGVKCERCWRYVAAVSREPAFAGICDRCQDALAETVNG